MATPDRIILPPTSWPKGDRLLWQHCREGRGPFGPDNPAVDWSDRRCKIIEDAWGRFLSWGLRTNRFGENMAPVLRLDIAIVKAFVADMKAGQAGKLAPVSIGMVMGAVCRIAAAFAPKKDWARLMLIYSRLKCNAKPVRNKHLRVVAAGEIFRLGIELMETAAQCDGPFFVASQFRDGLQIALWIARPIRIRNFQDLAFGTTFVIRGSRYWLVFSEDETKTGRAIEVPVPEVLMPYIDTYLREHRPVFGTGSGKKLGGKDLWLGRNGKKQQEPAIRCNIERRTLKRFGRSINPHLLRDCAATSFALEDPENVRCTMLILGHALMSTSERHYNQARSVEASKVYAGTMMAMRDRFYDYLPPEEPGPPPEDPRETR